MFLKTLVLTLSFLSLTTLGGPILYLFYVYIRYRLILSDTSAFPIEKFECISQYVECISQSINFLLNIYLVIDVYLDIFQLLSTIFRNDFLRDKIDFGIIKHCITLKCTIY